MREPWESTIVIMRMASAWSSGSPKSTRNGSRVLLRGDDIVQREGSGEMLSNPATRSSSAKGAASALFRASRQAESITR